ncbi:MAG TPA: hypothetical protein VFY78_02045, partial [Gammaproteobacteria bacterium]|nr:hypothetical protein [Gammaproteobacteria bacterium]
VSLAILYVARLPAQRLISIVFGGCNRLLRLLVKFLLGVNARLRQRNREVLLTRGREIYQYKLEKGFVRIADQLADDLSAWPSLLREMREQIARMDGEVTSASEQPPQPPEWLQVVDAVAQIPAHGSTIIAKILTDIHGTLKSAMEKSLIEYRQANRNRYALLNRIAPQWRSMNTQLAQLDKNVTLLAERAQLIDTHMQTYEQIRQGADQAINALTRSAASSLLLSSFLLLIACAGGIVNFQLLALPLSEVVGVHGDLFGVPSHNVATAVVIFLQLILGMFLLEAAGVTRLLPDMALMEKRKRRRVITLIMLALLVLAGLESLLVYTRDGLLADSMALNQLLDARADTSTSSLDWIPALGQAVIGFVLPLLLIFSVIAFETFIYAARTVAGMFLSWLLDVLAMLVRLLASLMLLLARVLNASYDLLIALPLYFERAFSQKKFSSSAEKKAVIAESDE